MKSVKYILSYVFLLCNILLHAQHTPEQPVVTYKHIGKIEVRTTHEIESSNWSVGGETMDRDYTLYNSWSPYLEELGIKKVRLQGGWAKCEKVKGEYDWQWLDEVIYDLPRKGIEPWVSLSYGNPLYGKGEVKLGSKIDTDPVTRKAWLAWVEAFVTRYKDVVDEWEIWNEPNGHNPPEVYAELLMQTSELIKSIQPKSTTIGFALAGIPVDWSEEVLKIMKQENKTHLVDYLCYHPYNFNPDASYETVERLHEVMKKYAPDMELFQGENGAPSGWRKTKALKRYEWTELTQAKWALRRMLGDLGRDIPSSIFSIIDLQYPDEMNRKGLLYANDDKTVGHKKQAYYAVQNLAAIFDHSLIRNVKFEARLATPHSHSAFAYANTSAGHSLVSIWLHTNRPVDYNATTPTDVTMRGVSFKNPVWVDVRTGDVYEIPKKSWKTTGDKVIFSNLALYDSPVLIAERDMLNLQPKQGD